MIWSDNHNGTGCNWLGLQLMLLRDELRGCRGPSWQSWLQLGTSSRTILCLQAARHVKDPGSWLAAWKFELGLALHISKLRVDRMNLCDHATQKHCCLWHSLVFRASDVTRQAVAAWQHILSWLSQRSRNRRAPMYIILPKYRHACTCQLEHAGAAEKQATQQVRTQQARPDRR